MGGVDYYRDTKTDKINHDDKEYTGKLTSLILLMHLESLLFSPFIS
jgi:hypothetical protein